MCTKIQEAGNEKPLLIAFFVQKLKHCIFASAFNSTVIGLENILGVFYSIFRMCTSKQAKAASLPASFKSGYTFVSGWCKNHVF